MFPKSVSTASQDAWYFVMPQTLTLRDTRNLTGSFIHLQWKHEVFNSKNVSITFRDFFHFGTAAPWQIAKERNSVVTAWSCRMLKPFCPGPRALSPYPEQLGVSQDYSAFCNVGAFLTHLALPLTFLFQWKWAKTGAILWRDSLAFLSRKGLGGVKGKLRSDDTTRKFMPEFFPLRKATSRC